MSSHRRQAARIDANQPEIVRGLRRLSGVTVSLDKDDILVGYKGSTYWIEIKVSEKSKVKPSQEKLLKEWSGHYAICWTLEQILYEIGFLKYECQTCWLELKKPECTGDHAAESGY